jgi:preprotein translocase subunit YajC
MSLLVLLALAFVLMWLLMIRPQRRKQNEQLRMQENLRIGEEIVTAGGVYGTVTALDEDEVGVEIAEGVVVRVARRAIAGVIPPDEEPDDEEEVVEGVEDEEVRPEPTEASRS